MDDEFILKELYIQQAQQISQSEQQRFLFFQNKGSLSQTQGNLLRKSQPVSLLEQSLVKMHRTLSTLQHKVTNNNNNNNTSAPPAISPGVVGPPAFTTPTLNFGPPVTVRRG